MGFDRIPEPLRSEVLAAQEVRQDVVLYWDELMRSKPEQLQARVEQVGAAIDVPVLAVFGQQLSSNERDYLPPARARRPARGVARPRALRPLGRGRPLRSTPARVRHFCERR